MAKRKRKVDATSVSEVRANLQAAMNRGGGGGVGTGDGNTGGNTTSSEPTLRYMRRREQDDVRLWVAIDFSIATPGMCICDTAGTYHMYFVQSRSRESGMTFTLKQVESPPTPLVAAAASETTMAAPKVTSTAADVVLAAAPLSGTFASSSSRHSPLAPLLDSAHTPLLLSTTDAAAIPPQQQEHQWHVTALPQLPKAKAANRIDRYYRGIAQLMETVEQHRVRVGCTYAQVHVGVEFYSLNSPNSNNLSKLCEAGGILRHTLQRLGCSWVDIAPAAVKLHFSNAGASEKDGMMRAWLNRLKLPDPSFHLKFKKGVFDSPSSNGDDDDDDYDEIFGKVPRGKTIVPKPIEDLVDSMGVMLCIHEESWAMFPPLINEQVDKKKKPRKKRAPNKSTNVQSTTVD